MKDISKFHIYSYGLVINDNLDNQSIIKVFPIEKIYDLEGDLNEVDTLDTTHNYKHLDTADIEQPTYLPAKEKITLDTTKYIYAEWASLNQPNRITPPNVCKGEYLLLYRYSNRDQFYWDAINSDVELRKTEHVVHRYSAKDSLDAKESNIEDSYYTVISSKDKMLKIHTSDFNGEYTTYDIVIDTKNGNIKIEDGKGNYQELDSKKDTFTFNLDKLIIKNKTTELVKTLSDFAQACIDDTGVGNLGIDVPRTDASVSTFSDIKGRIDSFIGK